MAFPDRVIDSVLCFCSFGAELRCAQLVCKTWSCRFHQLKVSLETVDTVFAHQCRKMFIPDIIRRGKFAILHNVSNQDETIHSLLSQCSDLEHIVAQRWRMTLTETLPLWGEAWKEVIKARLQPIYALPLGMNRSYQRYQNAVLAVKNITHADLVQDARSAHRELWLVRSLFRCVVAEEVDLQLTDVQVPAEVLRRQSISTASLCSFSSEIRTYLKSPSSIPRSGDPWNLHKTDRVAEAVECVQRDLFLPEVTYTKSAQQLLDHFLHREPQLTLQEAEKISRTGAVLLQWLLALQGYWQAYVSTISPIHILNIRSTEHLFRIRRQETLRICHLVRGVKRALNASMKSKDSMNAFLEEQIQCAFHAVRVEESADRSYLSAIWLDEHLQGVKKMFAAEKKARLAQIRAETFEKAASRGEFENEYVDVEPPISNNICVS